MKKRIKAQKPSQVEKTRETFFSGIFYGQDNLEIYLHMHSQKKLDEVLRNICFNAQLSSHTHKRTSQDQKSRRILTQKLEQNLIKYRNLGCIRRLKRDIACMPEVWDLRDAIETRKMKWPNIFFRNTVLKTITARLQLIQLTLYMSKFRFKRLVRVTYLLSQRFSWIFQHKLE